MARRSAAARLIAALLSLAPGNVLADDTLEHAAACSAVIEAAKRLSCYDGIFAPTVSSPLTALCERLIRDRLATPSTYRRVSADLRSVPVDIPAFRDRAYYDIRDHVPADGQPDARARLNESLAEMEAKGESPVRFTVTVEFDAENGFGALVRSEAVCTVESLAPDEAGASRDEMEIAIRSR